MFLDGVFAPEKGIMYYTWKGKHAEKRVRLIESYIIRQIPLGPIGSIFRRTIHVCPEVTFAKSRFRNSRRKTFPLAVTLSTVAALGTDLSVFLSVHIVLYQCSSQSSGVFTEEGGGGWSGWCITPCLFFFLLLNAAKCIDFFFLILGKWVFPSPPKKNKIKPFAVRSMCWVP